MKRMGFVSIALATVVAVGCDGKHKDVAKTTTAGDPAAVGTSGAAKVSSADKDFVNDLSIWKAEFVHEFLILNSEFLIRDA